MFVCPNVSIITFTELTYAMLDLEVLAIGRTRLGGKTLEAITFAYCLSSKSSSNVAQTLSSS
jgi:hypothetical protein